MTLMDISPIGSGTGLAWVAGIIFFGAFAATAFVVLKLLKKTVKMAFRMIIVGVILLIAIVGMLAFWWIGSGPGEPTPRPRPRPTQTR